MYSFIIPVYNRPKEIKELLDSFMELQFDGDYEILIIEDGSDITSKKVVNEYSSLPISYHFKENTGPGDSRNYGMRLAKGNYFIIMDSDCLIPQNYLQKVDEFLQNDFYDCFGGADDAHESFDPLQKAINYTMTSFLTTGGIRGKKHSLSRFEPRSFNMGISREAFVKTGGFAKIHPGEDPDLSQRMIKSGFKTIFIPNASVFHKRRISWKKFYQQVTKFGLVRPILNQWHPESAKLTYWFPTAFIFYCLLSVVLLFLNYWFVSIPLALYIMIIFLDSSIKNKSLFIGVLSIVALFYQFFGYGLAFLKSSFLIGFLKRNPKEQFPKLFFE
jgi:glycosyltransferase involved in cell wall biosynthesis